MGLSKMSLAFRMIYGQWDNKYALVFEIIPWHWKLTVCSDWPGRPGHSLYHKVNIVAADDLATQGTRADYGAELIFPLYSCPGIRMDNSLIWPSDAIWWHRPGWTLAQVMAWGHRAITWSPECMLTYHLSRLILFTRGQFQWKCSRYLFLISLIQNQIW